MASVTGGAHAGDTSGAAAIRMDRRARWGDNAGDGGWEADAVTGVPATGEPPALARTLPWAATACMAPVPEAVMTTAVRAAATQTITAATAVAAVALARIPFPRRDTAAHREPRGRGELSGLVT